MKSFFTKILLFAAIIFVATPLSAQENDAVETDSVPPSPEELAEGIHVSLLTCGGYDAIWALYGHSALRVQIDKTGEDFAVNYGLFDFNQPNFIGRFVFGQCDYMMGFVPFEIFKQEFTAKNAYVYQQELSLTSEEKLAVLQALAENERPENCMYRYNFFYDNCATRPRDIILNNIPDKIIYCNEIDSTKTFRQIIHDNNAQKPWCRLGNDLLLGIGADRPTTRANQQFLPAFLMRDFAKAQFEDSLGIRRDVVLSEQLLLEDKTVYGEEFPLTPTECAIIILAIAVLLTAFENTKKMKFWQFDALLLAICGIVGMILFLMIFSEHPTVSVNLLILMFNPLLLLLFWRALGELRRKRKPLLLRLYFLCLIISFITMGSSPLGLYVQYPPEGFLFVVAALHIRVAAYLKAPEQKEVYTKARPA